MPCGGTYELIDEQAQMRLDVFKRLAGPPTIKSQPEGWLLLVEQEKSGEERGMYGMANDSEMAMKPDIIATEQAAQLFAERDNVGSDASIWLRLFRQLFSEGRPLGEATIVCVRDPINGSIPFGALALTKRDRLIFWPVLP